MILAWSRSVEGVNRLLQLGEEGDDIVGYGEASLFGYGQDFDGYSDLFQSIYNNPTSFNPDQMQDAILAGTVNADANVATLGLWGIGQGIDQAATTGDYSALQDIWMDRAADGEGDRPVN